MELSPKQRFLHFTPNQANEKAQRTFFMAAAHVCG